MMQLLLAGPKSLLASLGSLSLWWELKVWGMEGNPTFNYRHHGAVTQRGLSQTPEPARCLSPEEKGSWYPGKELLLPWELQGHFGQKTRRIS